MSNPRKKFTPNEELKLHTEVDGACPICSSLLLYEKGNLFKGFEIAHIYPLNPTNRELNILGSVERLSEDPNDLLNVICLCNGCHPKFDKPRTIDEYNTLLDIKKEIIQRDRQKALWNSTSLEKEIMVILDALMDDDAELPDEDILEYDPKSIDDKVDSTITPLLKRKIHKNVAEYYHIIKTKFRELDVLQPLTTETISTQIKEHYLKLARISSQQKSIFEGMSEWITRKTNTKSNEACEIVASYFVQNCEIFR